MKKGKSIRAFLIAIVALAIVAVTAICVFGADGTVTRGDMNGDGRVDSDDAVYLLRHTFLPSRYPVGQSADVNGDGKINSDDAVYLLRYTFLPGRYPLACDHKEVTDAAKPATCTETGLTEGKHCSVCGKVLVEQKVIPITHDYDEQKFSIQVYALNMIESLCTERYARWCERSATQLMSSLLLDFSSCICTIYSCKYIFFVI